MTHRPLAAALALLLVRAAVAGEAPLAFDVAAPDTRVPAATAPAQTLPDGHALSLVQFAGPVQQAWLDALARDGVQPVQYVATDGYLVWTDAAGRAALAQRLREATFLRWTAAYPDATKLGRSLAAVPRKSAGADAEVDVVVQVLRHPGDGLTRAWIEQHATALPTPWEPVLGYANRDVRLRRRDLAALAARPDVVWIGERFPRHQLDERQDQILAGALDAVQQQPVGPGYLAWFASTGLPTGPDSYPLVDIADSGIGTGDAASAGGDDTLRSAGAPGGASRLAYVQNCTDAPSAVSGVDGHGHLNASILAGYDARSGSAYRDAAGYGYGLGVHPYARIGSTVIFRHDRSLSVAGCGGDYGGVIRAIAQRGARISSNSWGCALCAGTYDADAQRYDAAVRDADPTTPANDALIVVFSAGNSGPQAGSVGSPANAKNVITIGASESFRPDYGERVFPCGNTAAAADSASDVADFSSRGPAPGGRIKPDVVAPGTHVTGTASTSGAFDGSGVCGGAVNGYFPDAQTVFTASSGTSHAAPAVAGALALAWTWLRDGHGVVQADGGSQAPSPALAKAWLVAHADALNGSGSGGAPPTQAQGWGRANLRRMFDATPTWISDQRHVLDAPGEQVRTFLTVADPGQPVRVVLAYTDAPGALGTSPQVNDLDLAVVRAGTTYLGNVFGGGWSTPGGAKDPANNVEAVFLPTGTSGELEIDVRAANVAGDGVPHQGDATDQDYALVCTNCSLSTTYTISSALADANVCAGGSVDVPVSVGSVQGYSGTVALSLSGAPTGVQGTYAPASVAAPGTSTLTLAAAAGAPDGAATLSLVGSAGATTRTTPLALTVSNGVAARAQPTAPADDATGQPPQLTLAWNAVPHAYDYAVQVAADARYTTLVSSGTTRATQWPVANLAPGTSYWWRVVARNACAPAPAADAIFVDAFEGGPAWSLPQRFRVGTPGTPVTQCSTATVPIPDNNPAGVSVTQHVTLPPGALVGAVTLGFSATHSWPGDLTAKLKHVAAATSVDVAGRMGGVDCDRDGVSGAVLDDASLGPAIDSAAACHASGAGISGSMRPTHPLAAFQYLAGSSDWTFTLTDNGFGDSGSLTQWCVTVTPFQ